ncbi:IS110 family transposase [Escherichia coli]|uniref:IS110 family transposase n=1 Tax=Escherichia coli TaxID=562 RepID=UPI000FB8C86A|nr:IS110 family transposase [Escherichia coli]EFC9729322.1 IS110 family transposase [Escherichia coli]MKS05668.1 IS110 family transposase [Escherichia coli]HAM4055551.1 IS110 family transposase [Escherichia coli]HBB8782910.1 IS110 family transposase [Escherichia coli]HDJ8212714.1 IS110 family transposase [Escherichia coli]
MHSENIAAYIGLDVHKETLAVAIAAPERLGEVRYYGTINNEAQAVRRLFQKLQGLYGNILSCYEAGPCGFGLYHQLTAMNIKFQVIAPSRIPKSPTDRIKNDHRDAISLARLLRAGELTPVWIPDLTHEAMRDLIRARAAAKRDSRVARQRILSMLLRTDKRYAGKHWTGKHRTWLANQSFSQPSQQIAFQHYCQSLEQIEDRILQLDQEISRLLPGWSLCNLVCQLQALKGVGQLIAITLVAELGDFSRFSNPKQLMAFLGLVPGEYSSGNSIRPRGITKVGAWLIYYRPDSVTQYSKDIAWKAQQRLCSRYRTLTAKGKKSQVAITAVARELTGFMWDIALAAQSSFSQQKQN